MFLIWIQDQGQGVSCIYTLSLLTRHLSSDYDGRTPLHLASAEGRIEAVEFLVDTCQVHAVAQWYANKT